MKIILTGATGFVGDAVLRQCLSKRAYITHVFVVVRRPLPDRKLAQHSQVTEIVLDDFEHWPEHLLLMFKEADVRGCIWYALRTFDRPASILREALRRARAALTMVATAGA